ncbi:MAG: hypothetical protein OHK0029_38330 [Armatimonadaceae bacterium]
MKQEINPIFLIIAVVVALSVIIFVFVKASSPPTPPANSYTPGVPPWMEKDQNKTGEQPGVRRVPSAPQ